MTTASAPSDQTKAIQVSIILTVFNHEQFLARALESILIQKTNFRFEIVVGDDASTDDSLAILLDYSKRHPCLFNITSRKINLGGTKNFTDLVRKSRGRYITFIDGDDYWFDPHKLQIQFDFLENNPEFFSVSHLVSVHDVDDKFMHTVPDGYGPDRPISMGHFLRGKRFPLTATMLRSNPGKKLDEILELVEAGPRNVGDTTLCLYLLDQSPIPILKRPMSTYQCRVVDGHSNYNSITRLHQKVRAQLNILRINDYYYGGEHCFGLLYLRLIGTATLGLKNVKPDEGLKLLSIIPMIMVSFFITLLRRSQFCVRSFTDRSQA